ncbi:MAG: phage terminase large subunit family protein, partial [Desulfobacteraceae bacterium]|nr:phage terminase large subunit family protein [Desulfobacteraceae bacterium]
MAVSENSIPNILQWVDSRTESLRMDYSLSIAERVVKYYRIDGNRFGFRGFEWQIGILNDYHPRQVVVKRSQVGLTLIMMVKIILILEQYGLIPYYYQDDFGQFLSLSPCGIYTFENAGKVTQFSADRLKSFIAENPILQGLLAEGDVDQTMLKKFGNSSLYLGGRRTVESVTSIPAHIVLADEWDRTYDYSIGEQLESRLKASQMFRAKSQRGILIKYSTPEAFGV